MRIGIIGAGQIGGALTRRLTALGHTVTVANSRSPETLDALVAETGARSVWARDAAREAELLVVTVPMKAVATFPGDLLAPLPTGSAVVDTGNYYPQRDGRITDIEAGLPESVWVEKRLGHPVIKAFNNIPARDLLSAGRSGGTRGRIALPVAGDDIHAKALVMTLIDELGFDPVDAGPLAESWRQQPGSPVYVANLDAAGVREALAKATPERPAAFRA